MVAGLRLRGCSVSGTMDGLDVQDHDDGTYSILFTVTAAGRYGVSVTLGDQGIGGGKGVVDVSVQAALAESGTSELLHADQSCFAGSLCRAYMIARDRFGNAAPRSGIVAALFSPSRPRVQASVQNSEAESGSSATHVLQWTCTASSTYTLAVTVGGNSVPGAALELFVAPSNVSTWLSEAAAESQAMEITAGGVKTVVLSARDSYGNLMDSSR
jgi:hypothetical protein